MSYRGDRDRDYKDGPGNIMTDPSTANARIYVGNIPTNDMSKKDLEDRFKKHGEILGISLNRGFGFVQYDQETSAVEAIKQENGAIFRGKKMEVNQARVFGGGRRPGDVRRGDSVDKGDNYRERSPIDDRGRDWRDRDRYKWARYEGGGVGGGGVGVGGKGPNERDRFMGGRDGGFEKDGAYPSDNYRSGPGLGPREERGFGASSYRPGGHAAPPATDYPPAGGNVAPVDRANDCEIIVVNKNQREYAEYIEHRLKQLGMTVDLLFPNEDVPLGRVLANISSRGTLYAIVVMPQNEEHRSLTLNILHGMPQEHRNMPLEDAVPLIMRNFEAYLRGEKMSAVVPAPISVVPAAPAAGLSLSDRHPEAIQVLLNLLADNRQLTVLQYDRVIRYLEDKRELQLKLELGDAKDLPPSKPEPMAKQQSELQHRILNILNNTPASSGSGVLPVPPVGVPAPVQPVPAPVAPVTTWGSSSSGPAPLLSDPTVQKALDSLIQGDLLRKISSSTTATTTTSSASSLGTPPSQPLFGAFAGGTGHRF